MAFNTYETSAQDGSPVELYVFKYGAQRLDYTSAASDYTYNTRIYTAATIERAAIEETAEIAKSDLVVKVPLDFAAAELFNPYPPSDIVSLEIYRLHRVDNDAKLIWTGRVMSCKWQDHVAELNCESVMTSLKRTGLRRLYQRACPHILYGTACAVTASSFRTTATLSAVSGNTLTSSTFTSLGSGYLAGGYLEWNDGGTTQRRAIRTHSGSDITLSHPLPGLAFGNSVTVYAGCDHSISTCNSKFSNAARYGGFPHIPRKNPFGQNSVF